MMKSGFDGINNLQITWLRCSQLNPLVQVKTLADELYSE